MRRSVELVTGWVVATVFFLMMGMMIRPMAIVTFALWMFVTIPVIAELVRVARQGRRVREFVESMDKPDMKRVNRVIALPSSPPAFPLVEPSGMILLPVGDRDPRWGAAREHQRLQQSGRLHVDRDLRPLTDCPAGHYDYHELRSSSLDRAVRRCAWCPPLVNTWTEGLVCNEDSER